MWCGEIQEWRKGQCRLGEVGGRKGWERAAEKREGKDQYVEQEEKGRRGTGNVKRRWAVFVSPGEEKTGVRREIDEKKGKFKKVIGKDRRKKYQIGEIE